MKHIQIASLKRRLLSSLIDLTLVAGLFCLFYFCVFTKAVSAVQNYNHLNEVVNEEKLNSGLYIDKEGKIISLTENNPQAGEDELKTPVHDFYVSYLHNKDENYTEYWYGVHILYLDDYQKKYEDEKITKPEVVLFEWKANPSEGYQKKTNYGQDAFDSFYRLSCLRATTALQAADPVKSAIMTMSWGNIRAALYASLVATIIPCFVIPISLKNGKTIGKLITKLVVLTDEGYEYKRYKHIFRYISFYLFEVFGGVITIGLTLILTVTLTLFTKKRRALHDYIAFSVVVDEVHSVFYKDEDEELEYQKKSLEKLA